MTTVQIAKRLADLCGTGNFEKAQEELYADDVKSIEPHETPAFKIETKGIKSVKEKGEKWKSMVEEQHGYKVSGLIVAGNSFAFKLTMDITMKERGRLKVQEICVYQVKDEKIISEQFFS